MIIRLRQITANRLRFKPGIFITIRLDENPTTGYVWKENQISRVFLSYSSEFVRNTGGGLGAGGQRVFTFKLENRHLFPLF